jgi:hypothetical protein
MTRPVQDIKTIWDTLSAVDCAAHVKKKGKLDYLPWAWAWGILMEHYPDAEFEFLPEKWLDNKTVECCVVITISGHRRHMWLPVMDYQNKSLENPTTRDISDARMRCLVKGLALFGLGHSLYAGEDVPDADEDKARLLKHNEAVREHITSIVAIKECIATENWSAAYEAFAELEPETISALWVAPTKGGIFTTSERHAMKSNEWNDARKAHHNILEEDT